MNSKFCLFFCQKAANKSSALSEEEKLNFLFVFCQHFWYILVPFLPSPSYFFLTAATVSVSIPIFSISDTYSGNKAGNLQNNTIFLRHWSSYKFGLPKGPLYSVTNYLRILSVSHIRPPFKNLAISHDAVTFISCSPCYLLSQIFFSCLVQLFSRPVQLA